MKRLVFALVVIGIISSIAEAKYSGGTGTAEDPYKIADANDLLLLAEEVSDYNKCFIMTANVDLSNQTFATAIIARNAGNPFSGVFDGNDLKITNITIDGGFNSYLGLFGYSSGLIKNLGLENCLYSNHFGQMGGLAGMNTGDINNCYSTIIFHNEIMNGSTLNFYTVGGLVGDNYGGSISNCYSMGTINVIVPSDIIEGTFGNIGGLVGYNDGNISNCYTIGTLYIRDYHSTSCLSGGVGGLVGYSENGNICDCNTTYSIDEWNNYRSIGIGGLVGYNGGSGIYNCHSAGSVSSGGWWIGGLVGENYSNSGIISNCFSTASVNGNIGVGGLVGDNEYGVILRSYSRGTVNGVLYVGGLVGQGNRIYKCFSTSPVNGHWEVGGLVGEGGDINDCYSTGTVVGDSSDSNYVGGLVGVGSIGGVQNCYSISIVNGRDNVGGFMGSNGVGVMGSTGGGGIENCYSAGIVSSSGINIGGFAGYGNNNDINSSYFLITSGPNNGLGKPLTDEQMKQQSSFVGWDFVNETTNGTVDIWTIKENVNYPLLAWPLVNLISSRFPYGWYEVDFCDFAKMGKRWEGQNCADNNDCDGADFDFSQTVDINDLAIFCTYWLQGTTVCNNNGKCEYWEDANCSDCLCNYDFICDWWEGPDCPDCQF